MKRDIMNDNDHAVINLDGEGINVKIDQSRTPGMNPLDTAPVCVQIADESVGDSVQLIGDRATVAQFLREMARNLEHIDKATWETTITIESR